MSQAPASSLEAKTRVLSAIHGFEHLPAADLQMVAQCCLTRVYAQEETLFHEGEPCGGLHILTEGTVKVVKITPSGRQMIVAVQEAPGTIAEVPVFDGGPYPATVVAARPVRALILLREDFQAICRRHPDLALQFLAVFGRRLRHLLTMMERITFGNVRQRLAMTLLQFADEQGTLSFQLPESQEQLATRLATVREVVSRNLSRFQTEGIIRFSRRDIEILNRDALQAEADTEM